MSAVQKNIALPKKTPKISNKNIFSTKTIAIYKILKILSIKYNLRVSQGNYEYNYEYIKIVHTNIYQLNIKINNCY